MKRLINYFGSLVTRLTGFGKMAREHEFGRGDLVYHKASSRDAIVLYPMYECEEKSCPNTDNQEPLENSELSDCNPGHLKFTQKYRVEVDYNESAIVDSEFIKAKETE